MRVLAADPGNGLRGLDSALQTLNAGLDGDDFFADWVAANYLDDSGPDDGRYGYRSLDLPRITPAAVIEAGPAPAAPHSGDYLWWGGREQESDATLSRSFDLTNLDQATLTFYTWYDIEAGFDYAYVTASTNDQKWSTLPGQTTVDGDSNGLSFGHGYTNRSDG